MSNFAHESMTNHHAGGVVSQIAETIHLWRERSRTRGELARRTDRELQDIGVSWSDVACEAEKPFWRA